MEHEGEKTQPEKGRATRRERERALGSKVPQHKDRGSRTREHRTLKNEKEYFRFHPGQLGRRCCSSLLRVQVAPSLGAKRVSWRRRVAD